MGASDAASLCFRCKLSVCVCVCVDRSRVHQVRLVIKLQCVVYMLYGLVWYVT
jgi:hypothetical protein